MDRLSLTFASGRYDRLEALHDGTVVPEGIDLHHLELWPPRLVFDRLAAGAPFDLAELSCSEYICQADRRDCPFVALPVFPSRVFRHGFICVHRQGGIRAPKDLERKRIGVPLYTQTAAIWIRGLLENDYGVDLSAVRWVEGAVMEPGRHGNPAAPPMRRPPRDKTDADGRPLAELLVVGEIDAILGTFVDEACRRHPEIVRLFPDYRARERDYFARTGVFPIMHLVVMRRDLNAQHPWVAQRMMDAFEAAKRAAQRKLRDSNAQRYMLPWLLDDLEEVDAVFGGDPWPYGLEINRRTLETLVRYMHQQGFISRPLTLDELFLPLEPVR